MQPSSGDDDLLPRETEIPGWVISESQSDFTAETVAEYIKNPEEIRLLSLYGFNKLSVSKYKTLSSPEKEIAIEIYRMDSSINSFGILGMMRPENAADTESSTGYSTSDGCRISYIHPYSTPEGIFFTKGAYYIKILYTMKGISINDLNMFSKIICENIKEDNPLPGYLSLFADKDGTVIYNIEGLQKFPGVKKIFVKKVRLFEKTGTVFFARRNSPDISAGEFSNLLKNRQFTLSSAGDSRTAFTKISDEEYIFVSVFREWIFGTVDAESISYGEKTQAYLLNKIKEFTVSAKK